VLIHRSRDLQVFAFTPRGHPRARRQAVGVAARVRGRGRWRHISLYASWPRADLRTGRGTLSLEAVTWLTGPGTKERLRTKTFLRVKAGLGGAPKKPSSSLWTVQSISAQWFDTEEFARLMRGHVGEPDREPKEAVC
jgi:hypothetical protein